ncbi:MAG: hypothetical protein GQ574_13030 [Crocinitomix sp.]|nr:hypothetical protein [Crocinitomix sp.]
MKTLKFSVPVIISLFCFACNSTSELAEEQIEVDSLGLQTDLASERDSVNVEDYLYHIYDEENDACAYVDFYGDTVIPFGKYWTCFTDTLKTYAIVYDSGVGLKGIDMNENFLWAPFVYDNGPDYVHEGTFRIVIDEKMGFINAETGEIIIEPKFDFVDFFEHGLAEYTMGGKREYMGEYWTWVDGYDGGYVNKNGELFEDVDRLENGTYIAQFKGSNERVTLDSCGFITLK